MKLAKVTTIIVLVLCVAGLLFACAETGGTSTYMVIFDANGGDVGGDTFIYTSGDREVSLPIPQRLGYKFEGWFYEQACVREFKEDSLVKAPIKANLRVYAKWTKEQQNVQPGGENPENPNPQEDSYSVRFIAPDVQHSSLKTVEKELTQADLPNISRAEFEFKGWCLDEKTETPVITLPYALTNDVTLYAKWESIKYKMSFEGGAEAVGEYPDDVYIVRGATFVLPANSFLRTGYEFQGWSDGGETHAASSLYTLTVSDDIVFTAQWKELYDVVLLHGADDAEGDAPVIKRKEGDSFTVPSNVFTRSGYEHTGWEYEGSVYAVDHIFQMEEDGVTLTAVWSKLYSLTFSSGGETGGSAPQGLPEYALEGYLFDMPQNGFYKDNSRFLYWEYDGDPYYPGESFEMPADDIEFTAFWQDLTPRALAYAKGDGAVSGNAPSAATRFEGDEIILSDRGSLAREYYNFTGWRYNGTTYLAGARFIMPDEDVTFTAVWTARSYDITYYVGFGKSAGSGNPSSYNVETPPFSLVDLDIKGYAFEGWFIDDGYVTPVGEIDTAHPKNEKFYAKLTPKVYKIYLDDGFGGTTLASDTTLKQDAGGKYLEVTFDKEYASALGNLLIIRSGFELAYWDYNGSVYSASAAWTSDSDIDLTAVWTVKGTEGLEYGLSSDGKSYSVTRYRGTQAAVVVPSFYNAKPVTVIARDAFYSNNIITSITLPDSVTEIGNNAFRGTKLGGMNLPANIEKIGDYAFAESGIIFFTTETGSRLNSVGAYAFSGAAALVYVRFGSDTVNMGGNVFGGNPSALNIYSPLPDKPAGWNSNWNVGGYPFYWGLTEDGDYFYILKDGAAEIVEYKGSLETVNVPSNINGIKVGSLGGYAFAYNKQAVTVKLGAGITAVNNGAFSACTALRYVYLPSSVTAVGADAFKNCSPSLTVFFGGGSQISGAAYKKYENISDIGFTADWYYAESGGNVILIKYAGASSNVSLGNNFNGKPIISVDSGAFADTSVTQITVTADGMTEWAYELGKLALTVNYANLTKVSGVDFDYYYSAADEAYITAYKGSDKVVLIGVIGAYTVKGIFGSFNSGDVKLVYIPSTVDVVYNSFGITGIAVVATKNYSALGGSAAVYVNAGYLSASISSDASGMYYLESTLIKYIGTADALSINTGYDIGKYAFYSETLTDVTLLGAGNISQNAFGGNDNLIIRCADGVLNAAEADWNGGCYFYNISEADEDNGFVFKVENAMAVITDYIGAETDIVIPYELNGYPVAIIGEGAFLRSAVTSVFIPIVVREVGLNAFRAGTAITAEAVHSPGWTFGWNDSWGGNNVISGTDYDYVLDGDGNAWLVSYKGSGRAPFIPQNIDAKTVKGLVSAFYGNTSVTVVYFEYDITLVGAFSGNNTAKAFFASSGAGTDWYNWNPNGIETNFNASTYGVTTGGIQILGLLSEGYITVYRMQGEQSGDIVTLAPNVKAITNNALISSAVLYSIVIDSNCADIGLTAFGSASPRVYLKRYLAANERKWYNNCVLYAGLDGSEGEFYTESGMEFIRYFDGTAALSGYHGLMAVLNIPTEVNGSGVTYIYSDAFIGAESVTEISIPASVLYIQSDALAGAVNLDIIRCLVYAAKQGWQEGWNAGCTVTYTGTDQSETYRYATIDGKAYLLEYFGSDSIIYVPQTINALPVVSLGEAYVGKTFIKELLNVPDTLITFFDAIRGLVNLEVVNIPNSLKEIPDNAFSGFTKLRTVTIGAGSLLERIGAGAFRDLYDLAAINIPQNVNYIGAYAFANCESLKNISLPQGVDTIKEGAFEGCFNIVSFDAPGAVKIEKNSFRSNRSLKAIDVSGVTEIGVSAFENCASLTEIILNGGVTELSDYAFAGCTLIRSIDVGQNLVKIGKNALYNASALVSIVGDFRNVTEIGASAFEGCSLLSLENKLGEDLTAIGDKAFFGVKYLGRVDIGKALTSFGKNVFNGGVTEFSADSDNMLLKTVGGVLFSKQGQTLIAYPSLKTDSAYNIPLSVTAVTSYAFSNAEHLSYIYIPSSVTFIGASAVYKAPALTVYTAHETAPVGFESGWNGTAPVYWSQATGGGVYNDIRYVELGEEIMITGYVQDGETFDIPGEINGKPVTSVAGGAFAYGGVKWIYIPSGVTYIGAYAFSGNVSAVIYLEAALVPQGFASNWNTSYNSASGAAYNLTVHLDVSEVKASYDGSFRYLIADNEVTITRYLGTEKSVSVPERLEQLNVRTIAGNAFSDSFAISVWIPSTVTSVAASAFSGANYPVIYTNAASRPQGWTVGETTFRQEYINFNVTDVLRTGDGFEYIVDGGGLASITRYVGGAVNLNVGDVLAGYNVKAFRPYAFAGLNGLLSVTYTATADAALDIGEYAFANCRNLVAVELTLGTNGINNIGSRAFEKCYALGTVIINNDAADIATGIQLFYNCYNLEYITVSGDVSGWTTGWNLISGGINVKI